VENGNDKYHSSTGPVVMDNFMSMEPMKKKVTNAAEELGFKDIDDINGDQHVGFVLMQGQVVNGSRHSSAKAFLVPAKERQNLHIIKYAHVTHLDIDEETKSVRSVNIILNGTREMSIKARKEVILSAGAIGTPQILMLSGIGERQHLELSGVKVTHDLAGVGKNLQDHVIVPLFIKMHQSTAEFLAYREFTDKIYYYLVHKLGPLSTSGPSDLMGAVNTANHSDPYPDIQYHYFFLRKGSSEAPHMIDTMDYEQSVRDSVKKANKEADLMIVFICLLNPKSAGSILLRSSDPADKPKIYANYLDYQEDVDTLMRGIRLKQEFLKTKALKNEEAEILQINIPGCVNYEYDTDEYWECYTRHMTNTVYHPTSTAKMGPKDDELAVVNPRLKVYGINGLRVADASIMPFVVSANTNAATMKIGEKAADMIKEDWGYKTVSEAEKHSEL